MNNMSGVAIAGAVTLVDLNFNLTSAIIACCEIIDSLEALDAVEMAQLVFRRISGISSFGQLYADKTGIGTGHHKVHRS